VIPRNAQSLVDLRMRGLVPELPVLVSLGERLDFSNVTLYADPGVRYGWRMLAGLETEIFTSLSAPFQKLLRTLADIAAAVPARMILTFTEGARVDCGEMRTICHEAGDFSLFDWFPMAIGPSGYADGTKVARRLWAALGHEIPIPFDDAMDLVVELAAEKQCA
jgi:hypothetical protein